MKTKERITPSQPTMSYDQYRASVLFFVAMAGGDSEADQEAIAIIDLGFAASPQWGLLEVAREVMQAQTQGEYLAYIEHQKAGI